MNMTIHKQFYEYHDLKNLMYAQLKFVNTMGILSMCLGMTYMIYLTISLFVDHIVEPVAVIIAEAMVYGAGSNDVYTEDYAGWTTIVYKISGFTSAICFILMASYIIYYKSVVKVDAMQHLSKISTYCFYSYLIVGLVHCIFVTIFTISETVCPTGTVKCSDENLDDDMSSKNTTRKVIAILL